MASGFRQDDARGRTGSVKSAVPPEGLRYECLVHDVLFVVVVIAFFAVAVLLVIGCERILSDGSEGQES